ncbi:MAG: glycosyltransferase [Ferruginibacter sp.]|nr:glycosyltransferase [Cytophagales bacterium]
MHAQSRITVVIPLYNDWETLSLLFREFRQKVDGALLDRLFFLIVDDSSAFPHNLVAPTDVEFIQILHLVRNVGHQKAIAIGLAHVYAENNADIVVVMDSDGEDKPEDLAQLLAYHEQNPRTIVFAKRKKRREGFGFRSFYKIYQLLFWLLTGKAITFGNFSLIPFLLLKKLVFVSEIWNHFSGGIIRSKLPFAAIPLAWGSRLAGKSKMNFTSLLIHGLSSVAVQMDTVAVRLLLFSVSTVLVTLIGIFVAAGIRLFTEWAIPGWASFVVLGLGIIFMQACLIALFLVFMVLAYRTQQHFIPALHYQDFIIEIENIHSQQVYDSDNLRRE